MTVCCVGARNEGVQDRQRNVVRRRDWGAEAQQLPTVKGSDGIGPVPLQAGSHRRFPWPRCRLRSPVSVTRCPVTGGGHAPHLRLDVSEP